MTVLVAGNFSQTAGTLTEDGTATGSGIIFDGTAPHTYTSGQTVSNTVNFTVNSGATLLMGTSLVGNGSNGTFQLPPAGPSASAIHWASPRSGTNGNVRVSGTRTYNAAANYIYNGTVAQVTGNGLVTANNLTINNSAGVTLSNSATVNGILNLTSGDLSTGNAAFILTLGNSSVCNGTGDVVSGSAATGGVSRASASTNHCFGNPNNVITTSGGTAPTSILVSSSSSTPAAKSGAITRTYTITPTGGSGYTATVRLHYNDGDLNGNLDTALHLWKLSGSWADQDPTSAPPRLEIQPRATATRPTTGSSRPASRRSAQPTGPSPTPTSFRRSSR